MLWQPTRGILQPNQHWRRGQGAGGGGAFSFISGISSSGNSGGVTSGAIDTTGAGLLVAITSNYDGGGSGTISDNKNGTTGWVSLTTSYYSGQGDCNIHYCVPASKGSGHTANFTGNYSSIVFAAFALGAASPFDQQSGNTGVAGTATASSITPSVDNELVISGIANFTNAATTNSIDNGFTIIDDTIQGLSANYIGIGAAYKIQTTAAAVAPTWTLSTSALWSVKMASFKVS